MNMVELELIVHHDSETGATGEHSRFSKTGDLSLPSPVSSAYVGEAAEQYAQRATAFALQEKS